MASAATTDNPPNDANSIVINGDVTINFNYNISSLSPPTPLASIDTIPNISKFTININGTCNINYNLNAAVAETTDKNQVTMSKAFKWMKPLLSSLVFLFTLFAGGCT